MNFSTQRSELLPWMTEEYEQLKSLHANNKLAHAYLFGGQQGLGKQFLASHFARNLLCSDVSDKQPCGQCRDCELIEAGTHPDLKLIQPENSNEIKIDQIRQVIEFVQQTSQRGGYQIVIIRPAEAMNINSANALLKIIEEPNDNTFFILIHNSNENILSTLKSRCLNFKISLSFHEVLNITNSLMNDNLFNLINIDLINYYKTPGEIIKLIDFAKEKKINLNDFNLEDFLFFLIDNSHYKKNTFIKNIIFDYIELYFLKKYKLTNANKSLLDIYHHFIDKIKNTKKFNLDEESLFMEFKLKLLNE